MTGLKIISGKSFEPVDTSASSDSKTNPTTSSHDPSSAASLASPPLPLQVRTKLSNDQFFCARTLIDKIINSMIKYRGNFIDFRLDSSIFVFNKELNCLIYFRFEEI